MFPPGEGERKSSDFKHQIETSEFSRVLIPGTILLVLLQERTDNENF